MGVILSSQIYGALWCSNRKLIQHEFNYHQMTRICIFTSPSLAHSVFTWLFFVCLKTISVSMCPKPHLCSQSSSSVTPQAGKQKAEEWFWYLIHFQPWYQSHHKFHSFFLVCRYVSLALSAPPLSSSSLPRLKSYRERLLFHSWGFSLGLNSTRQLWSWGFWGDRRNHWEVPITSGGPSQLAAWLWRSSVLLGQLSQ